jgi:pyridoxal biosynthesis lyase PdxS
MSGGADVAQLEAQLTKVAAKRAAYKEASAAVGVPTAASAVYSGSSGAPFVFAGRGVFVARTDAAAALAKEQAAIDRDVRSLCHQIERRLGN